MWRKNKNERKRANIHKGVSLKKRLTIKFIKIVSAIVGVSLVILVVATYGYLAHANSVFQDRLARAEAAELAELEQLRAAGGDNTITLEHIVHVIEDEPLDSVERTTFMILGLDEVASLPDAIVVGVFNHNTMEINLISIPRDTRVELSSATVREMQALGGFPPASGIMRINAVHTHGRREGPRFVQQALEELLGFNIDYYVTMDVAAFRAIVDAVGGVTMYVPRAMFYNPYDQNLFINIPAGMQHLDGTMAEGLVRYRATYRMGDLQRIEMQQVFMQELFSQVLARENVIGNAFEYLRIFIEYVNTDFGVTDIPRYVRYVTRLSPDNISTYTLPGTTSGFFLPDPIQTRLMVEGLFWDGETDEEGRRIVSKEDIRIEIQNGGAVSGLAAQRREMLMDNGFVRVSAVDFEGIRQDQTRIISHNDVLANFVAQYLPGARIEPFSLQNRALLGNNDVVVVIGLRER